MRLIALEKQFRLSSFRKPFLYFSASLNVKERKEVKNTST